ncbi:uncharacterized protein [Diabrotica undecimpunctata]|uniref:uncharacterized protein n=1 Tax=Diabrotica undecimpunctata TaxID=50387 RepID=UPI003B63983A
MKLVELVKKFDIIMSKKTDGASNKMKDNAWQKVTCTFNATGTNNRNVDSLKKVFAKLKTEAKVYRSKQKSVLATGGGPPDIKEDPILEEVINMMGRGATGILNVRDCDQQVDTNIKINEDEDEAPVNMEWMVEDNELNIEGVPDVVVLAEVPSTSEEVTTIVDTPYTMRRRPKGGTASLNDLKIITEEKKRELLEENIRKTKEDNRRAEEIHVLKKKDMEENLQIKQILISKLKSKLCYVYCSYTNFND